MTGFRVVTARGSNTRDETIRKNEKLARVRPDDRRMGVRQTRAYIHGNSSTPLKNIWDGSAMRYVLGERLTPQIIGTNGGLGGEHKCTARAPESVEYCAVKSQDNILLDSDDNSDV